MVIKNGHRIQHKEDRVRACKQFIETKQRLTVYGNTRDSKNIYAYILKNLGPGHVKNIRHNGEQEDLVEIFMY